MVELCSLTVQGVVDVLCEACQAMKWATPTPIQKEALPVAFQGRCRCVCVYVHACIHLYVYVLLSFKVDVQVNQFLIFYQCMRDSYSYLVPPSSRT